MIDEFYQVKVDKISPEFPIARMISESDTPTICPGGAANVACMFKHLNVNVDLYGCCNLEQNNLFKKYIKNCNFYISGKLTAPIKKRFYDGNHPLYRWDVENKLPKENSTLALKELLEKIYKKQKESNYYDILIFSDYDKGLLNDSDVLTNYLKEFKNLGLKTIVDPKKEIYKWKYCTYIKPNIKEIEDGSNLPTLEAKAHNLTLSTCSDIIITNANKGVFIGYWKDDFKYYEYKPTKVTDNVNSCVGAGDCFLAFFSYAIASGKDIDQAVDYAFKAGQIYVQNKHNVPVHPHEIKLFDDSIGAKIVDSEYLKTLSAKIVFTNGCFDYGLTKGHINCLRFAKDQGDILIVALNSDASIKRIKGESRPIMNYAERSYIMAALQFVDYVVEFEEDTPLEIIKKIMPDIIVKGGDYKPEDVVGNEYAKVIICPFDYESSSTTSKIKKIN